MLFLLIAVASFILQLFLPWWIIAPVAFGLAWWKGSTARQSFWSGFGAIFVVWAVAALVIHLRNEGILTARIAGLFSLPLPELMIFISGLVGALVGGLAALSGFYIRQLFIRKQGVHLKARHDTVR